MQGMADAGLENAGPQVAGKWKTGKCMTVKMKDQLRLASHVRMHKEYKQCVSLVHQCNVV